MQVEHSQKVVVLVDAYSSGNVLAHEFIKKGCRCAHVQSRKNLPTSILDSFRADDFFINLHYEGNDTINTLKDFDVIAVIAGCETGIEVSDALAAELQVNGNNKNTSHVRRNKYLMQQSLSDSNLRHIPTYRITTQADAIDHAAELLNAYSKVVIKPVDSAGTDSVFVSGNLNAVIEHSNRLLNESNQLNLKNEAIILQPFIDGEEYVVDTVSYAGSHKICAIWKMGKGNYNGCNSICEFTELTSLDAQTYATLKEYVFSVLDAIGIEYGAGHSELFLTQDGWRLIETGARPHGSGFPALSSFALQRTQIDEFVLSICSPEQFIASIDEDYQPFQYLKIKELISSSSGIVESIKDVETILTLPSYKASHMPSHGQKVTVTTDVFTSPGWIALSHCNYDQLTADYHFIVSLEEKGMFNFHE
ncbi:ATP-grasp domain-containing protein [Vibrio spartinae]|uniref:Argininosuccinate lyase n=1 Tax=Vibrio spartinae TaxID=1918945 RepID=A0ABX6R693_9VIBR|nr:ATP-grasp domain-containing protein [Vibrio spartinae]QMV16707.1 argininosuccinate lyase [Vibrio spartinae]